jgi:hypothetical protein
VDPNLLTSLLDLPVALPASAWTGHIPFLNVLIAAIEPKRVVELGVNHGGSLIAAATAARRAGLSTDIVGIDTWRGDGHSGMFDGDKRYARLAALTAREFPNVRLMRSTFDEAIPAFAPASIDLLHIDGFHTYDAVRHDYETWKVKVAPGGVILFHDTQVRGRDFGVWRLWEELAVGNRTFEFAHSHGLGVLFTAPLSPRAANLLEFLDDPANATRLRTLAEFCGGTLPDRLAAARKADQDRAGADLPKALRRKVRRLQGKLAAIRQSRTWRLRTWLARRLRLRR